jgi:hypothetical protein
MSLPNTATKLNQMCGQISKLWKEMNKKVSSVITINSNGSLVIGTEQNHVL